MWRESDMPLYLPTLQGTLRNPWPSPRLGPTGKASLRVCIFARLLPCLFMRPVCSQEHRCQAVCTATGICEIETQPQSIQATFTGRHESFQYTKVLDVSNLEGLVVLIILLRSILKVLTSIAVRSRLIVDGIIFSCKAPSLCYPYRTRKLGTQRAS